RWVFKFHDAEGKRRELTFRTEKEAIAEKKKIDGKIAAGMPVATGNVTLGRYLDDWLERVRPIPGTESNRLRPSTYASYTTLTALHIKPKLGRIGLRELIKLHIDRFTRERLTPVEGKKPLSPRRVEMMLRVLHAALADAHAANLIGHNPVAVAEKPK